MKSHWPILSMFGLLVMIMGITIRTDGLERRIDALEAPAKCVAAFKVNHPGWNARDIDVGCGVTQ